MPKPIRGLLLFTFTVAGIFILLPADPVASSTQTDAWLEAKPACVFPIAAEALPPTGSLFLQSLNAGLGRLAITSAGASLVRTDLVAYPKLNQLTLDLSHCVEDADHKPPKVNWHFVPRDAIQVARLEISADPLIIQGATVKYDLSASDAELKMAQDRQGRPLLMLMGASDGHFSAVASDEDVQSLCLAAARKFAGKYGLSIASLSVNLSTPSPHELEAQMRVALSGTMGGTLHLRGRFDVADDLTATASHLSCQGDGPGGLLISGMLLPGLIAYNGKTKPLVVFPFNAMRLRDVRFNADSGLRITAQFASPS